MVARTSRCSAALLLAALLVLILPMAVLGHAELDASDPADGSTVEAPFAGPIVVTFTEDPSSGSKAELRDGAGIVASTSEVEGSIMTLTPDAPLGEGDYEVRWTATADDGHIERGTIRFTVVAVATTAPTATPTPAPTPTAVTTPSAAPSATPGAPASASPSATALSSTAPASPTSLPSGGTDSGSTPSGGDALLPIIAGALLVGALAFILLRRRGSTPLS